MAKENLPGEFVLRFDYKEKETSSPYPSEKSIFINNQNLELWLSPKYCNNTDSTWFQNNEKENKAFSVFSKENMQNREKISILQDFLMKYDDIASEFNNNEMSIAESLVARNICKCKLVSPASKPFTICNSIDASRLRSLTTVYDDANRKNIDDETPTHLPNHMAINVPNEPTSTVLILRKKQQLKQ